MVDYKFNFKDNRAKIEELSKACGLFFETTAILYSRGLDTVDKINYFLDPGKHHFKDPYTLKGVKEAVERIKQAKRRKKARFYHTKIPALFVQKEQGIKGEFFHLYFGFCGTHYVQRATRTLIFGDKNESQAKPTLVNIDRKNKGRSYVMSKNKVVVPEAQSALDKFKMEAAAEVGVNLKQGYNGDLTSRQAGSVGGQMVKKMIEKYENDIKTNG